MWIFILLLVIITILLILKTTKRKDGSTSRYPLTDARSQRAYEKGRIGESEVKQILGNTIDGKQYVIHNVLFSTKKGRSCQIDHIYINPYGIWVIETKNYAGRIYGTLNQQEWMQVLAYGNSKNKFYNPFKQNASHIYHLSEHLHAKNIFHNVVCFSDEADISNIHADYLFTISTLANIKYLVTPISLTREEMKSYYETLLTLQQNETVTESQHIQNIKEMQQELQNGICPRCGGRLIIRDGKHGQFYGCSHYPQCKFTKKL